jgi:hypothetical protein
VLLELHDRTLSKQQSAEYLGPHCEKVIRYASTAADWPEVVLGVEIIRRLTPARVSDSWAVKLADEIRTERWILVAAKGPSSLHRWSRQRTGDMG